MKKSIFLLFAFVIGFFVTGNTIAQEKAKTELSSVKQTGGTIRYTLTSTKPFIVGNNRYILHVAGSDFFQYEQSNKNGTGSITFLIPVTDFNSLPDGKSVFLTYGSISEDADMERLANTNARCWLIGKFDKDVLTK